MASKLARKPSELDRLLVKAGFSTHEELTEQLGIDRRTWWRWRTGSAPKRKSGLLVAVAGALDTTPERLLRMLQMHRRAG
jgi:transcriptional regulator with XRE-family HTH domain